MRIQYVADDGEIFDTPEECYEHEGSITKPLLAALLSIRGYTEEGEKIYTDGEDMENNWDKLWNDSAFLHLSRDLTAAEVSKVRVYFGYSLPYKKGVYRWDEYHWVSYENDYADFQQLWAPVNILLG